MYDLSEISNNLVYRIDEVLDLFDIEYTDYGERIAMCCPIHHGDNPDGFGILLSGVGNWRCFTHFCHEKYKPGIISLIHQLFILYKNDKTTFKDTLEWCAKFTNASKLDSETYKENKKKQSFIQLYRYITHKPNKTTHFYSVDNFISTISAPSLYFLNRGFSPEILDIYKVGDCKDVDKSMFERAVVPFFDDDGQYIVGYMGRSLHEKCQICSRFHDSIKPCPITKEEKKRACKWKTSGGFNSDSYLYNYWRAKSKICESGEVILVEGVGDVWKLEQSGIHNSVALLGTKFTDEQKIILECSGATDIIIATDADSAGNNIRSKIKEECTNLFNITEVFPSEKDFGDMKCDDIKQLFNR